MTIKLIIVDDDPLVCRSLQLLLAREPDIEVAGMASDGQAAVQQCEADSPDVVLMDIQMPGMDGIQATRLIKAQWPQVHVMMLTTFKDEQNIRLALHAGAAGYVLKSMHVSGIAEQIRLLVQGTSVLDGAVLKQLMQPAQEGLEELTPRESDIVSLIAQGFSNREVASQLFISEGTVRNTLSVILEKLQLRDRTQLAIYYWRRQKQPPE